MKIAHLADLHAGCFRYGKKRGKYNTADLELQNCLLEVLKEKPDFILISGDVYDNPNPDPSSRSLFNNFLSQASDQCTVIVIPGNHDLSGEMSALQPEEELLAQKEGNLVVANSPTHVRFPMNTGKRTPSLVVYPAPFIRDQGTLRFSMDQLIKFRGQYKNSDFPHVLMAHFPVAGCQTDTGKMETGEEGIYEWADHFDYVALGDLHVQQEVMNNAWYPGSPRWITFPMIGSKQPETKGYLLLDWKEEFLIYRRSCSSARRFTTIMVESLAQIKKELYHDQVVRAFILSEKIPVDKVVEALYENGADFVKPEYLLEETEVFMESLPEISQVDDFQILAEFMRQRKVSDEMAERVIKRAQEILV